MSVVTDMDRITEIWKDIDPVPQEDGPHPVAAIAYSDEFRQVMDYFRAVIQVGEKTERALRLTETIIAYNSANYTVWHYRREILDALVDPTCVAQARRVERYEAELDFVDRTARFISKNYQVWHHRREIVSRLGDGSHELAFTAHILMEDGKNYHSWAHRQWSVRKFHLWDQELAFVTRMLGRDCRNNSAWNQRYFVLTCRPGESQSSSHEATRSCRHEILPWPREIMSQEIAFTLEYISKCPNNESPWNYLRGLLRHEKSETFPELELAMKTLLEQQPKTRTCVYRLSFLVDLYAEQGSEDRLNQAEVYLHQLADELDPIRKSYWNLRLTQLRKTASRFE